MNLFLICQNPACRMVLDLRENGRDLPCAKTLFAQCPECGNQLSCQCQFCGESLEVEWRAGLPHCLKCHQKLRAEAIEPAPRRGKADAASA
jgi:hypothetical protein